jgi:hypothetical protein
MVQPTYRYRVNQHHVISANICSCAKCSERLRRVASIRCSRPAICTSVLSRGWTGRVWQVRRGEVCRGLRLPCFGSGLRFPLSGCCFGSGVATADLNSSFLYAALILARQVVASEFRSVCRQVYDHTAFYRLSQILRRGYFSCFR